MVSGESVYGPWTRRGGEYLIATADLVALNASGLQVWMFTKNEEEAGDGENVNAATKINTTTVGRTGEQWDPETGSGLKELVRYKFTCSESEGGWLLARMLDPVWYAAVLAAPPPPP